MKKTGLFIGRIIPSLSSHESMGMIIDAGAVFGSYMGFQHAGVVLQVVLAVSRLHDRVHLHCLLDFGAGTGTLQGIRCPWSFSHSGRPVNGR